MNYEEIEEILGVTFKDKQHLKTAFTHKSYVNESKSNIISYERYEFLGDAILEYVSSKRLFQRYPDKTEGELTKLRASLVCEYTLSQITSELGFGKFLILSHGEDITGGRNRSSILCDLFESVLGAIFLDQGMDAAEAYVDKFLLNDIDNKSLFFDAKSLLQEYAQGKGESLVYKVLSEKGPEHNKVYEVVALLDNKEYEKGVGSTKKMAEQVAAHKTIIALNFGKSEG